MFGSLKSEEEGDPRLRGWVKEAKRAIIMETDILQDGWYGAGASLGGLL